MPDAIVYSDSLPSDNALAVAGFRHLRKNHINRMENFWNQAKRHLRKFNDVPQKHSPLLNQGLS